MGRNDKVEYVCPVCMQAYDPVRAAEMGFRCHAKLARMEVQEQQADTGPKAYRVSQPPSGHVALQVIPADVNEVVPTVVEQILGTMRSGPLSLELAGVGREQMLILRGPRPAVEHARAQLEAGYGQIGFHEMEVGEDPVFASDGDGVFVASGTARLRRPAYFPIRTWRQFGGMDDAGRVDGYGPKMADPIRVLVGALNQLGPNERALAQVVLQRRAPDNWADGYQGAAQQVDFRMKAASSEGMARGGLLALGILLGFLDVVFGLYALSALVRYGVSFQLLLPLLIFGTLLAVSGGGAYYGGMAWGRLTSRMNANPEVVRLKVSEPAFEVALRFWAWSESAGRAQELLERVRAAYSVFDLAEGNALVSAGVAPSDPSDLQANGAPKVLLNLAEIAGMWHCPVGVLPDRMQRQMFHRHVPQAISKPSRGAVLIGTSSKGGEQVYLPHAAVESGMFLIGKPQTGKSNLMKLIAVAAMKDPGRAVVVVDPHQDMVKALMGLVPPERVSQVRCLDLAETSMYPGIGLLDMSVGVSPDKVVSDLVTAGQALWQDYWGPRMEQVLRFAAKTVALINRERVAQGHPERQLSVLFIYRLLLAPSKMRKQFLAVNMPQWDDPDAKEVMYWWESYYEAQSKGFRQEVISPVITKLVRLAADNVTHSIFGQGQTTLDLRQVIRDRGILLVNTGGDMQGADVGAFVGALVINYLDAVVREQGGLPREQRAPITLIVDEFQSIGAAVSWRDILGQLRKYGAHVVLGTQSLAGIREDNPQLPGEIFAGVMTTVAFQTNAEDAEYVVAELDNAIPAVSLTNVSPYQAYLKTVGPDRTRLPTLQLTMCPPLEPDEHVLDLVRQSLPGYCVSAERVQQILKAEQAECIDDMDAAAAENAKLAASVAESQRLAPQNVLLAGAAAMGTQASLTYGTKSGAIGRGRKVRRSRPRRPGAVRGFAVETE